MLRWVNSSPVLFAQPFEIKNRQRFRRFKGIAEKMSNLLSDGSVLALRPSLELLVQRIGKVLDVQYCHRLLLNSSIMEEPSRRVKANGKDVKTIQGLLRHAKVTTTLDRYSP